MLKSNKVWKIKEEPCDSTQWVCRNLNLKIECSLKIYPVSESTAVFVTKPNEHDSFPSQHKFCQTRHRFYAGSAWGHQHSSTWSHVLLSRTQKLAARVCMRYCWYMATIERSPCSMQVHRYMNDAPLRFTTADRVTSAQHTHTHTHNLHVNAH